MKSVTYNYVNTTKKKKKKTTICLNMIVKNEAHVIKDVLACMSKYIDYYVICDTGSTDNTEQEITTFMNAKKINGEIHHHEWKNFGHNRSLALTAAIGKGDYVWIIDADDLIDGNLVLPSPMNADGYNLKFGTSFVYERTQIVKNDTGTGKLKYGWTYYGVLHEYIAPSTKHIPIFKKIDGNYNINSRRLGARNKINDKYLKDAIVFEKELTENPNGPLSTRYYFYLAQSYRDAKMPEKAIENYWIRIKRGGWNEEVYYSHIQIGNLMINGRDITTISLEETAEIIKVFMKACTVMPTRAESLFEISKIYFYQENKMMAYHFLKKAANLSYPYTDKLFIDAPIYNYRAYDKLLICTYELEKYDEAKTIAKILQERLDDGMVMAHAIDRIKQNVSIALESNAPKSNAPKSNAPKNGDIKRMTRPNMEKSNQRITLYTPSNKKIVCIYVGYATIARLNDDSVNAIDSAENELRYLIETIATTNMYDIFVFQNNMEIIQRNNITYLHINSLVDMHTNHRFKIDILMIYRYINFFQHCPTVTASKIYLMAHDSVFNSYYNGIASDNHGKELVATMMSKIKNVIGLTPWHINKLSTYYELDPAIMITLPYLPITTQAKSVTTQAKPLNEDITFIYASSNIYVLEKLLTIIDLLHRKMNNSKFKIYTNKELINAELLDRMKHMSYVHYNGNLLNHEVIDHILSCDGYYLYPSLDEEPYNSTLACAARAKNCIPIVPDIGANQTVVKSNANSIIYDGTLSDDDLVTLIVDKVTHKKKLISTIIDDKYYLNQWLNIL
jgi:tetratricopeptide (TPR) repeat protein